jgi:uncharacterized protein YuzE
MGEIIDNPEQLPILLGSLKNIKNFIPLYDPKRDVFFIRSEKAKPATSFDWEGELWIRMDPISGEIVGLEIENFESIFLKKHPEVAMVWKQAKSSCIKKPVKSCDEDLFESFIKVLVEYVLNIFKEKPQQLHLDPI